MKDKKILEEAKERFSDAEDGFNTNRENARDDIKFARLGEQWDQADKDNRETEGRPCLTINRLPAFIRQVVNDARLNSPSIKVHPADDNSDIELAEIMTDIVRNIEYTSNAEIAYDNALEDAVTSGFGYFRVDIDYAFDDVFEMDLKIERIADPLSVYQDPYSREADASDWTYCFVVENIQKDLFKSSYPNADCSDWEGDTGGWITEDTVRLAEYWTREEVETELHLMSDGTTINAEQYEKNKQLFDTSGLTITQTRPSKTHKVMQYLLTSSEVLETNEWAGKYIPICPVYGDEVIDEDERHFISLVRPAKDAQRNYNYWRTASTEKVALATKAPWIGSTGSFDTDRRNWETANTETHPFLEYDGPIPPQQLPPSMADAGSITEALNASDDLKNIMGIQDASLGIAGNETSGKAINARQREGDISTFHFIDNLSRGIRYAGRVLLDLIPHVYNKPRVMRIMGADGTPDSVQVNEEFELNGMTKMHDLTKGKYDLIVTTGPSYTSKRDEAATQMTELLRSFPQAAPIIGDLVAKALDWPGADEIAKRLKTMLPPEIQAMEKMDGLPPEAQSAIAQAQQQVNQLKQVIDQGKQILGQKDEQIKGLELEKKSKNDELMFKETDSQRKYAADMAKVEADKEIVIHKENENNRRMIIEETTDFVKSAIDQSSQEQSTELQGHVQAMNEIAQSVSDQADILKALADYIEQDKSIEIKAPSGGVYSGTVEDGNVHIKAPSGAIYEGSITKH